MINVQNVTMRYPVTKRYCDLILHPLRQNHVTALSDASIMVRKGECLGLLGPNGAGKTTLLKIMGGLLYASEGSVLIAGRDARQDNRFTRKKVSYVLNEERSFYWRLTGRQNLRFFGALDNLTGSRLHRQIEQLLETVDLVAAGDMRVGGYSCGMRQRLAIARGLLCDPDILILDEPTKALDPNAADKLRELVLREKQLSKTIVVATHDIAEAQAICDSICILLNGHICECRTMKAINRDCGGLREFYRTTMSNVEACAC